MTSELKKELLRTLAEMWELAPDLRLGQLVAHLGFLGENYVDHGLGDIEDDELLAIMYRHRAELTARLEGAAEVTLKSPAIPLSVSGSEIPIESPSTTELSR
jgi:hypothetical protein